MGISPKIRILEEIFKYRSCYVSRGTSDFDLDIPLKAEGQCHFKVK
jgi:hypothetical protein